MKKHLQNTYILAILSGILLSLGWPTYGLPLLLFVAFVPLLLAHQQLIDRQSKNRKVFFHVYITFFVWNVWTTWWIWNSSPFGACFAILANALLMTTVFMLYHWIYRRIKTTIAHVFFVCIFICFGWFHLDWDFSWPWLNLGNAFSEYITWIQWYEYTGVFGGSLWILLGNIFVLQLIKYYKTGQTQQYKKKLLRIILWVCLPIITSMIMYVNYDLPNPEHSALLVQPNIDPYSEKYEISNQEMVDRIITMVDPYMDKEIDFIITPETALPENIALNKLSTQPEILRLQEYVRQRQSNYIGGFSLYSQSQEPNEYSLYLYEKWINLYNSLIMISPNTLQVYHKSKPVVGVEHFPYKNLLQPLLGNLMLDLGGTIGTITPQEERTPLKINTTLEKLAPSVCYESIYGEFMVSYVRQGASAIVLATNDAWWGNTQGHKQLISYARLRAIETRRDVLRSANTGISAFINQRGEYIQRLAYLKTGVLSGKYASNQKLTFYTLYGDYIARIALLIVLLISVMSISKNKNKNRK